MSSPSLHFPTIPHVPRYSWDPNLLPLRAYYILAETTFPPTLHSLAAWLYDFRKNNLFELPIPPFKIRNTELHPPLKFSIYSNLLLLPGNRYTQLLSFQGIRIFPLGVGI